VPLPTSFASGRYRVERFLGEGARKRVYLARDSRLERDVAFAVIKTEGLDETGLGRIQREAQSMARLGDHPNIVTVFDIGEEAGQPYIVSQYMPGGDVQSRLAAAEESRLEFAEALSIAEQIASALGHAHSLNVIHRDLKPGNVWLAEDGTAKLGDFGLAVATDRSRITQEGMMLGTVAYMSPEQAVARELDPRSDLYSLGAMLYEMVTGRPPFLGDDAVSVISQHLNTDPVAPSWHNRNVPRPLEVLILRLLAKDPNERHRDARAVGDELQNIRTSSLERAVAEAPSAAPQDLEGVNWGRFFGRHAELEQLKAKVDQTVSGSGALVMVVGEPGIGKTRLTEELAVYARLRGAQVLLGHCYEGEGTIPYLPFVESFRTYLRGRDDDVLREELGEGAPEVATLVSEIRQRFPDLPESPPAESDAERLRLFSSVSGFLENASRTHPIVLVLDDIHWADKPSLLLMQYLARRVAGARLLVVATYRDVELDRTHPLSEVVATLRRERSYERVLLRGLPESAIQEMLASAAGGDADTEGAEARIAFAAALYQETEGNPFFVREVLSHLIEEGKLYREEGRWRANVTSVSDLGIPEGVREVVGRRLTRLSEGCNEMLTLASAMTHGFDWPALVAISDQDDGTLLTHLEEALKAQVIRELSGERQGSYDFSHALIRQTLYGELSTPRRVLLHRRIAQALEGLYESDPEPHLAELAHHFFQAAPGGDVARAVDYGVRAGDRAAALLAHEEAAGHYERALQAYDLGNARDPARRYERSLAIGLGYSRGGTNDRALPALEQAAELADELGDSERMATAVLELADATGRGPKFGQRTEIPFIDRALERLDPGDSALRSRLLSAWVQATWPGRTPQDVPELQARSTESVEMARRIGDAQAEARALGVLHHSLFGPENTPRRIGIATEWVAAAERAKVPEGLCYARLFQVTNLAEMGEMDEVERLIPIASQAMAALREPLYDGIRATWRAMLLQARGRYAEAEPHVFEMIPIAQRIQEAGFEGVAMALLYDLRRGQGRLGELEAGLTAYLHLLEERGYPRHARLVTEVGLSLMYLETDRPEQAREWLERLTVEEIPGIRQNINAIPTLALAGDVCWHIGDRRRAELLYEVLLPYAERNIIIGFTGLMAGSASYGLGMLAGTLERWDDSERHFQEAIRFDDRAGLRPWAARARREYSRMLKNRGRPEDAARALELVNEAVSTFDELGMQGDLDMAVKLRMELQGVAHVSIQGTVDVVALAVEEKRPDLAPAAAPDGTVTLMFSDMEGFTEMTERLGDLSAREVIRAHNQIVREQLAAHGGYEVELQGDGFLLAFGSARRALQCAIGIQRTLAAYNAEGPAQPIRVRIGLHTGEALRDQDKFFGKTVILAARIAAQATGGEILVSSLLKALTESTGDVRFGAHREADLKGISEPQRLYEVEWQTA
jgi:class 3 adenylate cyclase